MHVWKNINFYSFDEKYAVVKSQDILICNLLAECWEIILLVDFFLVSVEINYVCADFIGDSITKITSNKGRGPRVFL